MTKNIKNTKLALVGILYQFAFSLVMAGGRIPINEQFSTTLRALSRNETKVLVDRVPAILKEALGSTFPDFEDILKSDTGLTSSLDLGLKELSNPLLRQLFPKASFYSFNKLYLTAMPRPRILEAVVGDKVYGMPISFNRLILGHSLKVTDKNMIELAKAFVLVALEGEECKFLEEKLNVDKKKTPPIYWVHLKAEINGQKQIFAFRIRSGQIHWATRNTEGGTDTKWYDLKIIE